MNAQRSASGSRISHPLRANYALHLACKKSWSKQTRSRAARRIKPEAQSQSKPRRSAPMSCFPSSEKRSDASGGPGGASPPTGNASKGPWS